MEFWFFFFSVGTLLILVKFLFEVFFFKFNELDALIEGCSEFVLPFIFKFNKIFELFIFAVDFLETGFFVFVIIFGVVLLFISELYFFKFDKVKDFVKFI